VKVGIAILLCSFMPCFGAQAQDVLELHHNPLAADLPMVVSYSNRSSNQSAVTNRRYDARDPTNGSRFTLTFSRAVLPRRVAPNRTFAGAVQARFFYFPQYGRRSSIGLTNRRKPALAPMPITYSPWGDPFYEEKELHRLLGDETPFYP
jgi:hypothetical protein